MFWPFVCGCIYLILSMPIMGNVVVDVSAAHSGVRLSLHAWGMQLEVHKPIGIGNVHQRKRDIQAKRLKKGWPLIRAALKTVSWKQTDIDMRLGLGDASHTAMLAGSICAGASALKAIHGRYFPISVHINPDFRNPCFVLAGRCIFSLVPGDIMLAVLLAALKKTGREGFRWRSIRLKV